jgi:preprotein translocase subunit SecG
MHQILLVTQVLVAVALIGLILLQQGRGADAGAAFGSGSSGSIFGSRGPASFLVERYQDEVPDPGVDAGVLQPGGEADVPSGTEGENSGPVSDVPSTPEPSGQEQQN